MADYSGTDNLEAMAEAVNYNAFLTRLILSQVTPDDRVVDFGAGLGTFALAVAAAGHSVHCIEPDAAQLARIRAAGLEASADLSELEGGAADLIYSLNVLEHIDDDLAALATCFAKLRPGGRMLIYVPAFPLLYSSMDRKVGHVRRYTRAGLAEKAAAAGFSVERVRYADSIGFLATLVFKWVGNKSGDLDRGAVAMYDRFAFPLSRLADLCFSRLFGKNLWLVARRPPAR